MRSFVIRAIAPFVAVLLGMFVLRNAWLSIVLYHVQILFWTRRFGSALRGWSWKFGIPFVAVAAAAGPACYFLLPLMQPAAGSLAAWLSANRLSGVWFLALIPYFGLVHPVLEQVYWADIRERAGERVVVAHLLFAGYHMLVLYAFLKPAWLAFCFFVLFVASAAWHYAAKRAEGGLLVPLLSHIVADSGIVIAVYLFVVASAT